MKLEFLLELSCRQNGRPLSLLRCDPLPSKWGQLILEEGIEGLVRFLVQTSAKLPQLRGPGRPRRIDVTEALALCRQGLSRKEICRRLSICPAERRAFGKLVWLRNYRHARQRSRRARTGRKAKKDFLLK